MGKLAVVAMSRCQKAPAPPVVSSIPEDPVGGAVSDSRCDPALETPPNVSKSEPSIAIQPCLDGDITADGLDSERQNSIGVEEGGRSTSARTPCTSKTELLCARRNAQPTR